MVREFQKVIGEECLAQLGGETARRGGGLRRRGIQRDGHLLPVRSRRRGRTRRGGGRRARGSTPAVTVPRSPPDARCAPRDADLSCSRTPTARCRRRTRYRPGSTTPGWAPSTPISLTPGLAIYDTVTDDEALDAVGLARQDRGDHPRPGVGPCHRLGCPGTGIARRQDGARLPVRAGRQGPVTPDRRPKLTVNRIWALFGQDRTALPPVHDGRPPNPVPSPRSLRRHGRRRGGRLRGRDPLFRPVDGRAGHHAGERGGAGGRDHARGWHSRSIEQVAAPTGKPVAGNDLCQPGHAGGRQASSASVSQSAGADGCHRPRPAARGERAAAWQRPPTPRDRHGPVRLADHR